MKSEPTLIIEAIRAVLILLTTFGVALTSYQQSAIILAAGALIAVASAGLAWWNRNRVFAPATVEKIAEQAAATGVAAVGDPPAGPAAG